MGTRKQLLVLPGALLCASVAMAQVAPTSIFQLNGEVVANPNYPLCQYLIKDSNPPTLTSPVACDTWALLNGSGTVGEFKGSPSDHFLIRSGNLESLDDYFSHSQFLSIPIPGWPVGHQERWTRR